MSERVEQGKCGCYPIQRLGSNLNGLVQHCERHSEEHVAELERELAEARFKLDKLDKLTVTLTCTNARMARREAELKQQLSTARADERKRCCEQRPRCPEPDGYVSETQFQRKCAWEKACDEFIKSIRNLE